MPKAKLNLSPGFDPFSDRLDVVDVPYSYLVFPGGEPHIKITNPDDINFKLGKPHEIVVSSRIQNSEDLFKLILAKDAIDRMRFFSKKTLFLPYFPGARQDRVCVPGEAFSAGVYASIINSMKFDEVIIVTPHSDVATALIENVTLYDTSSLILLSARSFICRGFLDRINVICPDAGAGKRTQEIAKIIANGMPNVEVSLVRCEKVRDVKDGKLKEFHIDTSAIIRGAPMLIFDDIVAYGGTFLGLAQKLTSANPEGDLGIFVTHADCQAGLENLAKEFDQIFVTDSKSNWELSELNNLTLLSLSL